MNKPKEKKKVKGVGNVYPCPICGKYPEWGAAFLRCPNDCVESDYNDPNGQAVRSWNRLAKEDEMPHIGDLLDDLQALADFKHSDVSVAEDAIEEIKYLRAENAELKVFRDAKLDEAVKTGVCEICKEVSVVKCDALSAELAALKSKTLECSHCCNQFPVINAVQVMRSVYCSEECATPYRR